MDARVIHRIDTGLAPAVSTLFGAALGYAAFLVLRGVMEPALAYALAAGAAGSFASYRFMAKMQAAGGGFRLPSFTLVEFEAVELDELLLTDADRLTLAEANAEPEPLILDDILAEIDSDSRVVSLFDRKAMQTPGQLKAQVDGHLRQATGSAPVPDASRALSDALAELRRSLR